MIGDIIQKRGLEALGRYYSKYRGLVVDDHDPDGLNRLKVVVPEVSNQIVEWAFPIGQMGAQNSGFKGLTPKIGSVVWVTYKNGDPLYPLWQYHGWALEEKPGDLEGNDTMGIVTPMGHKILLQDENGVMKVVIVKDEQESLSITLNKDGLTKIEGKNIELLEAKHGIPLVDKLVTKLNQLEKQINDLKNQITISATNFKPGDGGSSIFTSLIAGYCKDRVPLTKIEDIENPNIKQ